VEEPKEPERSALAKWKLVFKTIEQAAQGLGCNGEWQCRSLLRGEHRCTTISEISALSYPDLRCEEGNQKDLLASNVEGKRGGIDGQRNLSCQHVKADTIAKISTGVCIFVKAIAFRKK